MRIRFIAIILLVLPFCGCVTHKVSYDQLEDRVTPTGEVLPYLRSEAQPFSGIAIMRYENGQKWYESQYRNGIEHGVYRSWHPNGQLNEVTHYLNGSPNGRAESSHENGQRKHLGRTRDGQYFGKCTQWHSNGSLKCKSWTDDQGHTTKKVHWYPSGQKRCIRIWENNGWTFLEEWNEDGDPIKGTAEQRNALDS
ncbi:MAG: hypothetical protein HN919_14130 [Verrucomicrobia bacterium]|jgi:antitoxin component YwqK of YwqJK toxin-antitoxin module|nr:hypothetical protein [Verrucomicrobiota bacterium]